MEDRLNDALYNTMLVFENCRKCQKVPLDQKKLVVFRIKVNSFFDIMKNWSKKS
jgi:hypothetical protein